MVIVSNRAKAQLEKICNNNYVRLAIIGGGCAGFSKHFDFTDIIEECDTIFSDHLVIDDVSQDILGEATIDFVTDLLGERWEVNIPEAKSSCGCGISFSL